MAVDKCIFVQTARDEGALDGENPRDIKFKFKTQSQGYINRHYFKKRSKNGS